MSELTLLYVHGDSLGYGRAGTLLAKELARRGVTVYDDDGHSLADKTSSQRAVTDGRNPPPSPTNAMCWVSVPTHTSGRYEGQHTSIVTMWEAMSLPASFRETVHEFDLLMVPSEHNVELFSKYHPNVQLLLLGVDPEDWNYSPAPEPGPTFDFLIAGRGKRKGVDLAYEAFQRVFGQWWQWGDDEVVYVGPKDRPIPRLVMKSLKGHGDYYAPGIKHVTGKLSQADEIDLYRSVHAYVQPSRGEGFGLQPLQALAVGRPTILTDAHGHASYAHLGIPIDSTPSTADYFIYGDAGEWWEPDLEQVCEAMWDVYENYDKHALRAEESAQVVADQFTTGRTAERFLDLMGDQLSIPYSGSGRWVETERKLYEIVCIEDHMSHAAGKYRYFQKGRLYYDLADIKRILFDAGKLDPVCLYGDDIGITPGQLEDLDEYIASKQHCPTCSQRLNMLPTKSDDIMAGSR